MKKKQQRDLLSHVETDPMLDPRLVAGARAWLTHAIADGRGYLYPRLGGGWNYCDDVADERWDVNDWIRIKYPVLRDQALAELANGHAADPPAFEVRTIPVLTPAEKIAGGEENTHEGDDLRRQRAVWRRARVQLDSLVRRIGIFIIPWLLLLGVMAACSGPAPTPPPPVLRQVQHLPHQGALDLNLCIEASPSYTLTAQATAWIADGLTNAARENADRLIVTLTWIDADPLSPASSPLSISIPATGQYPPEPTLVPTPGTTGSPWQDASARQKVEQSNLSTIDAYNSALAQVDAQIAAARDAATTGAQAVRSAQPPANLVSNRVDLWACVVAAARRFAQLPPGTTKVLCFASAMDERNGWVSELTPAELSGLKGSHIVVVFFDPQGSASFSEFKKQTWVNAFSAVSADPNEVWLDAAQSEATSPAMLFAYAIPAGGS